MADATESESLGATVDTTVIVTRSVSKPVKDVWKFLVSKVGAEALLGAGGELVDKGHTWRANDGTYGVVRSYHPLEQIRFSWHAAEEAPKTLVDVHLHRDADEATRIEIVHSGIPVYFDTAKISQHWENAFNRVDAEQ
ncbi:MAG: SRPBCC domain-containing protein [Propionibacteriaceae bacterium]|jgi:uncharacterized protein YndB with AHSA1/START domain|nr:SRPBCC domain-containing protein [Micropruina sp.]HBX81019.1 hypothetical protein [Propionibacteriaceae bacterium]HBY24665.1 hypothetical protein [Propionibacteriaceae bacterium]